MQSSLVEDPLECRVGQDERAGQNEPRTQKNIQVSMQCIMSFLFYHIFHWSKQIVIWIKSINIQKQ